MRERTNEFTPAAGPVKLLANNMFVHLPYLLKGIHYESRQNNVWYKYENIL